MWWKYFFTRGKLKKIKNEKQNAKPVPRMRIC